MRCRRMCWFIRRHYMAHKNEAIIDLSLIHNSPPSSVGMFFQNKGIFFDFNDLNSDTLSFAKALCSSPIPTFGLTHSLHMPS